MDIILDTTVLSNFASVDALNLIKRLFGVVYTTHEVHEEILRGISRGYQYLEDVDHEMSFDEAGWLRHCDMLTYGTSFDERSFETSWDGRVILHRYSKKPQDDFYER